MFWVKDQIIHIVCIAAYFSDETQVFTPNGGEFRGAGWSFRGVRDVIFSPGFAIWFPNITFV
jgi:hypothetical protein